jgi:hypothetical protein
MERIKRQWCRASKIFKKNLTIKDNMKHQKNEFKPGKTDTHLQGSIVESFGQDGAFAI